MESFKAYRERMQIALKAADICVYEVDIEQQRYTFFENAEAFFGKSGEQILREVEKFVSLPAETYRAAVSEYFSHPDDQEVIDEAFAAVLSGQPFSYDARMKAGESQFVWCRLHVMPVWEGGKIRRMVGVISNIRNMKEKMIRLEDSVRLDAFTRLYSKQYFMELCDELLSENPQREITLLVIDLDHFKMVNDNYGHIAGDETILSVADHLRAIFRKSDIVARFGGDEFTVLMLDAGRDAAVRKARQILTEKDNDYQVTKSIGIAVRNETDLDGKALFTKADMALYGAKKVRGTYVVYGD